MTWFQSDFSALKMSGSGDMKSSGDMTKVSSVPYLLCNQVEIASVLLKKKKWLGFRVKLIVSGSGDMKSSGDMTKASSVPYLLSNQVEIASVLLKKKKCWNGPYLVLIYARSLIFPSWNFILSLPGGEQGGGI